MENIYDKIISKYPKLEKNIFENRIPNNAYDEEIIESFNLIIFV